MDHPPLILAYHSIHARRRDPLAVSPGAFEKQLAYLSSRGYRSMTLAQAGEAMRSTGSLSPKTVVITFDDGYRDNFLVALPRLRKYGFTATVFVVAGLVSGPNLLKPEKYIGRFGGLPEDYEILKWNEVRKLHESGIEIGSHTVNHPDLTALDEAGMREEIRASKKIIEGQLGQAVESFCYPSGKWNAQVKKQVEIAGFKNAVQTHYAHSKEMDFFRMPRVGIYRHNRYPFFKFKISGMGRAAYSLLHTFKGP